VLGLYLTLAPFGGNLEGVRAASLAYFGKGAGTPLGCRGPRCWFAIPRSPERLRPPIGTRRPPARPADRVLLRMAESGGDFRQPLFPRAREGGTSRRLRLAMAVPGRRISRRALRNERTRPAPTHHTAIEPLLQAAGRGAAET